ncbi:CBS domain-containing protein [Deinococcus piscis]|uniref:CBS domain-containing protein n=1 Tax=Deinococcus piscis TaxID=394230 RepID=A0ABQ3KBV6_9DEIO|nr:CBS domain-containing protein [Deinococcus piscis]GHG10834.1 CBS domain-containing protein [Deinococcus piscis]
MTTLKEIMTGSVTSVRPSDSVQEAARLMRDGDIGNVLVMEDQQLQGIITDRDIAVRVVAEGKGNDCQVSEVATMDVFTMESSADVKEAAREMASRQLRRLPVTEGGKVVGIVSLGDLAVRTDSNASEHALEGISQQ